MYKIFGAVAIIGLFLLSSIASAGLASMRSMQPQQQAPQQQPQQQAPQQNLFVIEKPLPAEVYWNGVGDLDGEWDGDGQDGGQYYQTYEMPEDWGMYNCETLPFPAPLNISDWWKPQYICTAILVKREGDTAQFKAIVRNIGLPSIQPFVIRVRVWKILPFPPIEETKIGILGGLGIGWRKVITNEYPWGMYGGSVVVWTDWGDQVDEYLDQVHMIPRIRRFVSNNIPGANTSIRWWAPWNW